MSDGVDHLRPHADELARVPRRPRRRGWQLLSALATLVVVVLVVVLASVLRPGSTSKTGSGLVPQLTGGPWSLDSITAAGSTWKAPAGNRFALTFTDKGYTGNDSCNGTSGAASYGTGTVHLAAGPMTAMGCIAGDQGRMQDGFRLLLDNDLPVSVADGVLTITAGQTVFALSRVQPAAAVDLRKALPGTTWALVSVGSTGADVSSSSSVPADVHGDIAFRTKDFSANDGCNSHGGAISYDSTTVTFVGGDANATFCDGPSGQYGSAYTQTLQGTVPATIVGDTLTLAGPKTSLTFTRETPAYVEQRLTANAWNLLNVNGHVASGWTLTMTATSYRAESKCHAYNGAVSYGAQPVMQADTTEGSCEAPVAPEMDKAYRAVFAGPVNVSFERNGMTLSANGSTLTYAAGSPTSAALSTGPVASAAPAGGIKGMKNTLIGSTWKLLSLKTPTTSWHAIAGSLASLTFAETTYQVSDGCVGEGYSVSYDDAAARVTFARGDEGSGMACSLAAPGPPKGTFPPQAYFDALLGPLQVALTGDELTLTRTGVVLTFSKQATASASAPTTASSDALVDQLVGWLWQIKSTTLHGVTTVAPSGSRAAINFSKGELDASDDTGADWHGTDGVTYGTATITMHSVAVTDTPYQGTRIEDAYTAVLRDTVTAKVVGTTLTLSAHGGELVYTRAYAAPYKNDFLAPIPAQTTQRR